MTRSLTLAVLTLALTALACDEAPKKTDDALEAPAKKSDPTPGASAPAGDAATPIATLEADCSAGTLDACNELGTRIYRGLGTDPDPKRAHDVFERSCDAGSMAGCADLAILLQRGHGAPADPVFAYSLFQNACNAKVLSACANLGSMMLTGQGATASPAAAVDLLTTTCDAGNHRACTYIGFALERGIGTPKDVTRATSLYATSCDAGDPLACFNLGVIKSPNNALGATPDPAAALRLFSSSCDGGHIPACYNLGAIHFLGQGTPKNLEEASRLFTYTCDRGHAAGCLSSSQLADGSARTDLLELSCRFDASIGCAPLGQHLLSLSGPQRDLIRAVGAFTRACDRGIPEACTQYARMLNAGDGIDPDSDKALAVAAVTCKTGHAPACELVEAWTP